MFVKIQHDKIYLEKWRYHSAEKHVILTPCF